MMAMILSLSVSADALACGFSAGASRIKVPLCSAFAAAAVSGLVMACGCLAGRASLPLLPADAGKYISFGVLALFGLLKLGSKAGDYAGADRNADKTLSLPEGAALGAALSADGLAAGFGSMADGVMLVWSVAGTVLFTTLALYGGAKGGRSAKPGRTGNVAAGLALTVLAAMKLIFG